MSAHIDGVFFINLDRRVDRLAEISEELSLMGIEGERFSAVDRSPGILGCGLSHLSVLKLARERGYRNVLIFEDDFTFLVSKQVFWRQIRMFFDTIVDYDVVMLSYNAEESMNHNELCFRVLSASTASGYIVNSRFFDALIRLYEEAMPLLESTGKHWIYANDQVWKRLQPDAKWYGFCLRLGKQRRSYSDNSLQVMDFGL